MAERRALLLTGATGLLGQYLLQDLLLRNYPVAVLVRSSRDASASERVARIVALCSERTKTRLPMPTILEGDLGQPDLGLSDADETWLARHCRAVIHSAASLTFQETSAGEPWRTNVAGTEALLAICQRARIAEWHHVSTAFVCGKRTGHISEKDLSYTTDFHNAYEESKAQAEQLVRRAAGMRATIYRPSIIVGAHETGHTSSYSGLYRFLEMAVRLASLTCPNGQGHFPLRLPLSGEETWDLVCVDWVSRAIVEIMAKREWHGLTFHLTSRSPTTTRLIRDTGAELLKLQGVEFAGLGGVEKPSRLEESFGAGIEEYWPYLMGNPRFDSANTVAATKPAPPVDRVVLERLIRFAVADRWGRGARRPAGRRRSSASFDCGRYIEQEFAVQAQNSKLAQEAGIDLTAALDLGGPEGGQWSCEWRQGEFVEVRRGLDEAASVTYHTDAATFEAIVKGKQNVQEAFFDQRIAVSGDLETALKLAVLFGQFLAENPVAQPQYKEATHFTVQQH